MILTCPNCATRYEADAAKFQPSGRKVRCAKCGHMWHQPAPQVEPAEDAIQPDTALAVEPQKQTTAETPKVVAQQPMMAARSKEVSPAWRMGALAGWAALIALVAILGFTLVKFRHGIVTVWPQTSTFYAAMGMDVNTVGLAFQNVSYRVTSEDDLPILHIKGQVLNVSGRAIAVPQIQASLTDDARRDLYDWTINADAKNLEPGKTTTFSARLQGPPSGARHVDLKFVKG